MRYCRNNAGTEALTAYRRASCICAGSQSHLLTAQKISTQLSIQEYSSHLSLKLWPACAHLTDANQGVNAERAERAILGFVKSVINGMLLVSIIMVLLKPISANLSREKYKFYENFQ